LEHLDLSFNQLFSIDSRIFGRSFFGVSKPLKFLNLENNKIISIENVFINYLNLEILKLSNNLLKEIFSFDLLWGGAYSPSNYKFFYENNKIKIIKKFPQCVVASLQHISFDFNEISSLELNAFFHFASLVNLSISNNLLENITKNNFERLFSLKYLNLSWDILSSIEMNSFINLNKLISLDLSFNHLHSIETGDFNGLNYLNDLLLMNQTVELNINNESFSYFKNIRNIRLSNSVATKYKCLFVNVANKRNFTRNIRNKFKFYKSLNLITNQSEEEGSECDLIFHLFQFRVHFNLRTDYENEQFYEKCKHSLIETRNSFANNQMKCLDGAKITNEISLYSKSAANSRLLNILTDYVFYLVMALILSLLIPVFFLVINHLRSLEWQNGSSELDFEEIKESTSFKKTQFVDPIKMEIENIANEGETVSNTSCLSIEPPKCANDILEIKKIDISQNPSITNDQYLTNEFIFSSNLYNNHDDNISVKSEIFDEP
jgi:hypothetical protein